MHQLEKKFGIVRGAELNNKKKKKKNKKPRTGLFVSKNLFDYIIKASVTVMITLATK